MVAIIGGDSVRRQEGSHHHWSHSSCSDMVMNVGYMYGRE